MQGCLSFLGCKSNGSACLVAICSVKPSGSCLVRLPVGEMRLRTAGVVPNRLTCEIFACENRSTFGLLKIRMLSLWSGFGDLPLGGFGLEAGTCCWNRWTWFSDGKLKLCLSIKLTENPGSLDIFLLRLKMSLSAAVSGDGPEPVCIYSSDKFNMLLT
jgi:hypothetical protein